MDDLPNWLSALYLRVLDKRSLQGEFPARSEELRMRGAELVSWLDGVVAGCSPDPERRNMELSFERENIERRAQTYFSFCDSILPRGPQSHVDAAAQLSDREPELWTLSYKTWVQALEARNLTTVPSQSAWKRLRKARR